MTTSSASDPLASLRDTLAAHSGTTVELHCKMQPDGITINWSYALLAKTMTPHVNRRSISEHYALTSAEADTLEILIAEHNVPQQLSIREAA